MEQKRGEGTNILKRRQAGSGGAGTPLQTMNYVLCVLFILL